MATAQRATGWVLIVGAHATARMELFRALERTGLHATAVGLDAAIDLLRNDRYDLVLFDAESEADQPDEFAAVATEASEQETAVYRFSASANSSRPAIPSLE